MKKQNTYLIGLPYILLVSFTILSVYLSIHLTKMHGKLADKHFEYTSQLDKQSKECEFRIGLLQQVLELNILSFPNILPVNDELFPIGKDGKVVIYLKRDGCSACNIGVVRWALLNFLENDKFFVFSHTENEYFLQSTTENDNIIKHERVTLSKNQLYPHPPRGYDHDAEIVFLNHENRVTGIIPLEYLKIEGLFDGLIEQHLKY